MIYTEAEHFIKESHNGVIRLGLGRIEELLERLGCPQKKLKFIHVAGTNGKGSVCAMTAEILKAAGYKTGLFTSPVICVPGTVQDKRRNDFRRRICKICRGGKKCMREDDRCSV